MIDIFEKIKECKKCELSNHQLPLIDLAPVDKCEIFWVGLSAKLLSDDNKNPLSSKTNSGSVITTIEECCGHISGYRTNLVKCAPIDEHGKLRYPNNIEIQNCICHLCYELQELSPKIVFLLGKQVVNAVSKKYNVTFQKWTGFDYTYKKIGDQFFVPIHHPSYIYVYRRKQMQEYIDGVKSIIEKLYAQ